jgi:hypothetical protein
MPRERAVKRSGKKPSLHILKEAMSNKKGIVRKMSRERQFKRIKCRN